MIEENDFDTAEKMLEISLEAVKILEKNRVYSI